METIQNQILRTISSTHQSRDMEEILEVLTSLFECRKKENNDIISDTKNLREETYDIISDAKHYISTLKKKIVSVNVEIDIINQYEHGDVLVNSSLVC